MSVSQLRAKINELALRVGTTGLLLFDADGYAVLRNPDGDEIGWMTYDRRFSRDIDALPPDVIYIRYITVLESLRGMGYGSAALGTLLAKYARKGYKRVWVVPLKESKSFSEKQGFAPSHRVPHPETWSKRVEPMVWAKNISG